MHGCLECGGSVGESEGHDKEFVCAVTGGECCFVFVAASDGDLMISAV